MISHPQDIAYNEERPARLVPSLFPQAMAIAGFSLISKIGVETFLVYE